MSDTDLLAALREGFGFESFNPGQREVIEHLMAGRSAAAVFATGAGKSLCYQLPATLLPGLTLVVSPLIALMNDQITALRARGIVAHKLDSTLSFEEYKAAMDQLRSGEARLLYVAPERFNNERLRESLLGLRVSLFAVDEAHCISEWGHNFRPDYLKLAHFAKQAGAERVLALTATATPAVLDDICRVLDIDEGCAVRTPFHRPNLRLELTPVSESERDAILRARLSERPPGPAIVYVTLQRTAELVAEQLARHGVPARPYHAGMDPDLRAATQAWFGRSSDGVVVATIAFGMGIDKPDIRYVYHYNLPKSLENYSQEIGRAGRDGAPSTCELLACVDDLVTLENFVYGDTPTRAAIGGLLEHLFALGEDFDIALRSTSSEFDVRELVLRTLLTYLELRGYLVGGTPFYAAYEFKPLMPSAQLLAQIDAHERGFVRAVLTKTKKGRVWFHLDADATAKALGVPRGRVVRVLDDLAEREMLELRARQLRHRYRVVRAPTELDELADQLYAQMAKREHEEIGRLHEVLALVGRDGCQASGLGEHFGEPLEAACGRCSWCTSKTATPLPSDYGDTIDAAVWAQAEALRAEQPEVLGAPRSLARMLCGIRSPALTRAKLHKHALFGAQARVPFAAVLERANPMRTPSMSPTIV
ncbi:RecQ family ATP-dependent DNA helicase [Pseudenhygromyxa sp. WMMC2535]|uniref:RecQ family ATP-dependent DNA helicase n=1 Tax=Pseudenhygromyxa sp. WMMC2535 TaxID=2712867 RepID=UPI0031FA04D6